MGKSQEIKGLGLTSPFAIREFIISCDNYPDTGGRDYAVKMRFMDRLLCNGAAAHRESQKLFFNPHGCFDGIQIMPLCGETLEEN